MTVQPEEHLHKSLSENLRPPPGRSCDARPGDPTLKPCVTPLDLDEAQRFTSALALLRHYDRLDPENWALLDGLRDVLTDSVGWAVEGASEGLGAKFSVSPTAGKLRELRGLVDADGDLNGVVAKYLCVMGD